MRRLCFLLTAILAGCTSVSEVTPWGSGTFSVTSTTSNELMEWSELRTMAVTKANTFCDAKGKNMEMVGDIKTNGVRHLTTREATVNFKCV